MKYSIVFLGAIATSVVAQDISSLSPCGQACVSNVLGLAPSLGCANNDYSCLCANQDFGIGISDCANEACGAADAAKIIAVSNEFCKNAGSGTSS